MFKYQILKFLSVALFLLPGNPTSASKIKPIKTRFLTIHGFLTLLAFGFVLVITLMQYKDVVAANINSKRSRSGPGPGPDGRVKSMDPLPSFQNSDSSSPMPPMPEENTAKEVSKFSDIFNQVMSCTLNLALRIVIWIVYPEIVKICQRIAFIKLSPKSFKWTRNEICLICVSITALLVKQIDSVVKWLFLQLDKKKFDRRMRYQSGWGVLMAQFQCFFGEGFAIDLGAIFLVALVTLVTKNLEDAIESFQTSDPLVAWSLNQDLPIEHMKAYQIAKLLQVEPPRKFLDANANTNGTTRKRNPNPKSESKMKGGLPSILKVNQLISTYFEWSSLWKEAQLATGLVTLILFLKLTLSVSFLCFLSITSIIDGRKAGMVNWETFENIPFAIFNAVTLVCIGNAAFGLTRVTENLQFTILRKFWNTPPQDKRLNNPINSSPYTQNEMLVEKHLSMLLESLSQSPINLTALGFFTVSRSTLTSILGVIITYLVVLIQFRTSASSDD